MKQYIVDRHTDPSNPSLISVPSEKIPVYDTKDDAEADLANLTVGQFVATKDTGDELAIPVDSVQSGNLHAVTSNAVAQKFGKLIWFKGRNITKKTPSDRAYFIITDFFPDISNNYIMVQGHGYCTSGRFQIIATTTSGVDTAYSNLIYFEGESFTIQANTTYSGINFDIFAIETGLFTERTS